MDNNRFIIENFLSKEDCQSLIDDVCKTNNWEDKGGNSNVLIHKTNRHDIIKNIHKKINEIFESKYYVQLIRMVHKTTEESFWEEHTDNSGVKETADIIYGIIIYLNEDFDGGSLEYSDMSIKPKTGMLVCHAGNIAHKVSKVDNGNRYTVTTFIRSKNDQ